MTGGFATIAGGVLALYIAMGISPVQLIGASVMSAPAALMVSKMMCPDGSVAHGVDGQDESRSEAQDSAGGGDCSDAQEIANGRCDGKVADSGAGGFTFPPATEDNVIEAAGNGASTAIVLVANIAAMLIAFISLIQLFDTLLGYFGGMVDVPELSFELICGYVFTPVAWLIGTPRADCFNVAQLIGTKIFVNEFVAYSRLEALIAGAAISERAQLTATYALCGFSNFGSIGVQLGGLSALCPDRRSIFAKLVFSAMVAGNICCFMTAAVAGILAS